MNATRSRFRSCLVAVLALTGCSVHVGGKEPADAAAPPLPWQPVTVSGNDRCAEGHTLAAPGGRFSGDTNGLADDFRLTCAKGNGGYRDAAFAFTLARPSRVHVEVNGGNYNSAVAITTGGCPGQEVACNDDTVPFIEHNPRIDRDLEPGSYHLLLDGADDGIRVLGTGGPVGGYVLEVALLPIETVAGPTSCASPSIIAPPGGSYRGDDPSGVLRFQVDRRTDILFDTTGSGADIHADLRSGACDGPLVASHDGKKVISSAWLAARATLDPGVYFIAYAEGPNSVAEGVQIDVAVRER